MNKVGMNSHGIQMDIAVGHAERVLMEQGVPFGEITLERREKLALDVTYEDIFETAERFIRARKVGPARGACDDLISLGYRDLFPKRPLPEFELGDWTAEEVAPLTDRIDLVNRDFERGQRRGR